MKIKHHTGLAMGSVESMLRRQYRILNSHTRKYIIIWINLEFQKQSKTNQIQG